MDLAATLATAVVFLTLGAFGYVRLRKPAASEGLAGRGRAEQTRRRSIGTIQQVIAHDEQGGS